MSTTTQQEIATPDTEEKKKDKVRSQRRFSPTKYLVYTAVFAALAILMKFIGLNLLFLDNSLMVTPIYMIWLMAAAVLGPFGGGMVCFVSDVLGSLVFSRGAFNPLITLTNTLYGVVAALVFRFTPGRHYSVKFVAAGIVCTILFTCLGNTAAKWFLEGYYKDYSLWEYFVGWRILQPAVAGLNIALTLTMIPLLIRIKLLPKLEKKPRSEGAKCQTYQ